MSGKLTEEQLRRIEENKRKALAKRAGKLQAPVGQNSAVSSYVASSSKAEIGVKPVSGPSSSLQGCNTNTVGKLNLTENTVKAQNVSASDSFSVPIGKRNQHSSSLPENISNDKYSSTVNSKSSVGSTGISSVSRNSGSSVPRNSVNNCDSNKGATFGSAISGNEEYINQCSNKRSEVQSSTGNSSITLQNQRLDSLVSAKPNTCTSNVSAALHATDNNSKTKTIDHDKIEENRRKALARRAEKLTKSPVKTQSVGNIGPVGLSVFNSAHSSNSGTAQQNHLADNQIKPAHTVPNISNTAVNSSSNNLRISSSSSLQQSHTNFSSFSGTSKMTVSGNNNGIRNVADSTSNMCTNSTSNFSKNSASNLSTNSAPNFVTNSAPNFGTNNAPNFGSSNNTSANVPSQNVFSNFTGTPVKGGCFLVTRERFDIVVGYSAPLVELFKCMKTKLYDAVTKRWSFKLSEYNSFMAAVRNLKPAVEIEPLPKAVLAVFSARIKGDNPPEQAPMADLSRVEPSLVNSLMTFQREGVNFGIYKNGRVLIADDMGLGKTIQAICLSCYYRKEWPLLVVVPSSVRFDWAQNFLRWVPSLDSQCVNVVVTGKESCTSGLINILSYDIMARKADVLKNKRFQVVIMDECHLLKNYKTARCRAATPILQNARRVFLLSGTPAMSRPSELYTQIDAVCPFLFKFHDFGVRYCAGNKMQWGWDYSGSSNMKELQILLEEKIMIRRLKTDVLKELPDKVRKMILLDPGLVKINKDLKEASAVMASGNLKKLQEKSALLEFFHKSGSAKMKAIKCYVEDLLECDKKFLIFGHHGDVLDGIEETVKTKNASNYMRIDGKTSSEQRNLLCRKFQDNDDIKVAILSITAANAGLNLSSACLVVFAELFWNPGILVQAEDRAHRIGQQDMVNVQYLVARGTSDDHIWPMIQKKLDVLGKAGLSKDNFSKAETTRLSDQRQEEITKFLEESFCEDSLAGCDDNMEDRDFSPSPQKGLKQSSILKYTSPAKDLKTSSSSGTPPRERQSKLLQFFSPSKTSTNSSDQTSGHSCQQSGQGQRSRSDRVSEDDDLEKFLKESDEEFSENNLEPVVKKRKILW